MVLLRATAEAELVHVLQEVDIKEEIVAAEAVEEAAEVTEVVAEAEAEVAETEAEEVADVEEVAEKCQHLTLHSSSTKTPSMLLK